MLAIIFSLRHYHQNSMYLQSNLHVYMLFSKLLNLSSKPNITQNWIRQQLFYSNTVLKYIPNLKNEMQSKPLDQPQLIPIVSEHLPRC